VFFSYLTILGNLRKGFSSFFLLFFFGFSLLLSAYSNRSSRLPLLPCFLFFFSNSLFIQQSREFACMLSWFCFLFREGASCNISCCRLWERGRVFSFSPPCIYIPHNCDGGVWKVVPLCSCSSLSYPRTGFPPSQILPRAGRFAPLDFVWYRPAFYLNFC